MKYFLTISIFIFSWLSASSQITQGKNDVVKVNEVKQVFITREAVPFDLSIKPAKKEIVVSKIGAVNNTQQEVILQAAPTQVLPIIDANLQVQKKSIIIDSTLYKANIIREIKQTQGVKKIN